MNLVSRIMPGGLRNGFVCYHSQIHIRDAAQSKNLGGSSNIVGIISINLPPSAVVGIGLTDLPKTDNDTVYVSRYLLGQCY